MPQIIGQLAIAKGKAARKTAVEDEKVGNAKRACPPGIEPTISAIGRGRTQDCLPLDIVERGTHKGYRWQKNIIFHVKKPRHAVGAFDKVAHPAEIITVVAQHRVFERTAYLRRLPLDQVDGGGQFGLAYLSFQSVVDADPAFIDRFPQFTRNGRTGGARILPRTVDQVTQIAGIGLVAQQIVNDLSRIIFLMAGAI